MQGKAEETEAEAVEEEKLEEAAAVLEEEIDKLCGVHPGGGYGNGLFEVGDELWDDALKSCGVHLFDSSSFPHTIPDLESEHTQQHLRQLRVALEHLAQIKRGEMAPEFLKDPDGFLREVLDYLPSDEAQDFQAGGLTRHWWVWKEFLAPAAKKKPETANWILDSLEKGVKWDVV